MRKLVVPSPEEQALFLNVFPASGDKYKVKARRARRVSRTREEEYVTRASSRACLPFCACLALNSPCLDTLKGLLFCMVNVPQFLVIFIDS